MDRKILKNYIYNIAYQLVKIALPLFLTPFLYRNIGAETLGISDFASNIAAWFILFGILGINTYGNRQIAKVRNNKDDLSKTFFEILTVQVINMAIASILYFVYVSITVKSNIEIYYLTGFVLLATMFDITWFFYGVEDFKRASIRNIIVKLVGVALIFIFIRKPEDLWLYVIFNSCSEVLGQTIMFTQLKGYISFKKVSIKEAYKNHLKPTFILFLPTIAISVYTLLDQTMIGYLYNTTHVNYYKTAMAFVKMFLYFITSIGAVMLPRVTNVFYNEEEGEEKAKNLIYKTMRIALLLSLPMAFGMVGIARDFVTWFIPNNPIIGDLIVFGSPIVIFISMSNVTGIQYMVPTGMYNKYTISVVSGSVTNFIINACLIPFFGAYGAIIGSIIAEATVTIVQLVFIYKEKGITFGFKGFVKYIISAIAMYIVVKVVGATLSFLGPSLMLTLIQVAAGALVYFVLLIILKDELIMVLFNKVFRKNQNA